MNISEKVWGFHSIQVLMGCDVREHTYYLDYKNRRSDYIEAFWKLINWNKVEKRYHDAVQLNLIFNNFALSEHFRE